MSTEHAQKILAAKFPELLMEITEYLSFVDTEKFVTEADVCTDFHSYMEK